MYKFTLTIESETSARFLALLRDRGLNEIADGIADGARQGSTTDHTTGDRSKWKLEVK